MPSSAESMSGPLRYDQNQLAEGVEKYGLYTYDGFADYITYELTLPILPISTL